MLSRANRVSSMFPTKGRDMEPGVCRAVRVARDSRDTKDIRVSRKTGRAKSNIQTKYCTVGTRKDTRKDMHVGSSI